VPDQSQSYSKSSPPRQQEEGVVNNPSNMAGNDPSEATPESQASNVNRASEGQQAQAGQAIEGDPHIGVGNLSRDLDPTPRGGTEDTATDSGDPSDNYDDEDAWPYRSLQQEAKSRHLPGDGKRDELVARLRQSDQANAGLTAGVADTHNPAPAEDTPRQEVSSSDVDNGGIQRTEFARKHAEILQGLSAERRQQQLSAVRERASRADESTDATDEESVNA
jgi:hypothetical protein